VVEGAGAIAERMKCHACTKKADSVRFAIGLIDLVDVAVRVPASTLSVSGGLALNLAGQMSEPSSIRGLSSKLIRRK
jgi:hypothetical protein